MGLSKSHRIWILLAIDSAFFVVELIVGYGAHSLALVADSFHMVNDVLSLCVGLWAVKVAGGKGSSNKYTYGWQRAETLGALVNGVFLVALCLSIFLDSIQRFVEPQVVTNPKIVLIVGCCGLLSNILGLLLFHEHGHSHGHREGEGHSHDALSTAEDGQSNPTKAMGRHTQAVSDESGNVADILPQATVGNWPRSETFNQASRESTSIQPRRKSKFTSTDEDDTTMHSSPGGLTPPVSRRRKSSIRHSRRSGSRSIFPSADELSGHPASFRREFIAASRLDDIDSQSPTESSPPSPTSETEEANTPTESSFLISKPNGSAHHRHQEWRAPHLRNQDSDALHTGHLHREPKGQAGSGAPAHSHDQNMRGVFLHVMGDALGNIGVIASALIIWLTTFPQRYYIDPAISLVITLIILSSAIPLCKAASRILLQAVPDHISVDDIKNDIEDLPGVVSCHHLHVWQLSDVKLVASLHIQVEFDFKGEGSARYMQLAHAVRRCLHEYGIHSSTIQPEFCLDEEHRHIGSGAATDNEDEAGTNGGKRSGGKNGSKGGSRAPSLRSSEPDACLLDCSDSCAQERQCCPSTTAGPESGSGS